MDIKTAIKALGITREEVLERAARMLADDAASEEYVGDSVRTLIKDRVEKATSAAVPAKIDAFLSVEMERYLAHEYTPVDIWGEATGKPTSIRGALHAQAKSFWEVKVDKDGKPSTWNGTVRYEWMFSKILGDEFQKAINRNITDVIGGLKDALRTDARAQIDKHLDTVLKVLSAGDKAARGIPRPTSPT